MDLRRCDDHCARLRPTAGWWGWAHWHAPQRGVWWSWWRCNARGTSCGVTGSRRQRTINSIELQSPIALRRAMHKPGLDTDEEIANSSSHGLALLLAGLATPKLLDSTQHLGPRAYAGVVIFVATMALLYGASTAYHALPPGRAKQWFLKLDHAAIYLFIAGSYTPFVLSQPTSPQSIVTLALVWAAATVGFVLKAFAQHATTWWSTGLYVAMGWLVLAAALPLINTMPALAAAWLVIGGIAYTVGVVFFLMDSALHNAHAVWHVCVAAGTTCHVFAVLTAMAHTTI